MFTLTPARTVPSDELCAAIERAAARPRNSITDVYRFMTEVQPYLEGLDTPAAHFNALYSDITRRVGQWQADGLFRNPEFLTELDIQFAERYVQAMLGWLRGDERTLMSWRLVFDLDCDDEVAPVVSAALGVNAHINADLTFALLWTYQVLGIELRCDGPEYEDYQAINAIFQEAIPPVREALNSLVLPHEDCELYHHEPEHVGQSLLDVAGVLADDLENWFAGLIVIATRDQAWDAAEYFWPRRDEVDYIRHQENKLDHVAYCAGLALNTPAGWAMLSG